MNITPLKLLGVVNLALAGGLVSLWLQPSGALRNATWAPPAAIAPDFSAYTRWSKPPAGALNPAQYMVLLERPLFAPDRKPPPPADAVALVDPMADVQIAAIMTGELAGVLARVQGRIQRVKLQESIGAWTLKSVAGRDAKFTSGEQTRTLQLPQSKFGVPDLATASLKGITGGGVTVAPNSANNNMQDEARERLRRRNEMRAARGLPPITD
jgi:hypothetical protein